MKRIMLIILVAFIGFGLTGCNSKTSNTITNITNDEINEQSIETKEEEKENITVGSIILLDNERYIVISQEDESKYLVLKQNPLNVNNDENLLPLKEETDTDIAFNISHNNFIYENSDIDNYLENYFYQSLSDDLKNAINETAIQQEQQVVVAVASQIVERTKVGNLLSRHVFLPSLSDMEEFILDFSGNEASFAGYSIHDCFFEDENGNKYSYWLRDDEGGDKTAHVMNAGMNNFGVRTIVNATQVSVRPEFVVDLSLIEYQSVGKLEQ